MTSEAFEQESVAARELFYSVAQRILPNHDDAADVVQDVMLKLWDMHDDIQESMLPLGRVLTRNLAIDRQRRRKPTAPLETIGDLQQEAPREADERLDRLLSILDRFPDRQQTIFRLRHTEGMEIKEIAQLTGMTEVAIRKSLSRTRIQMLQIYQQSRQ